MQYFVISINISLVCSFLVTLLFIIESTAKKHIHFLKTKNESISVNVENSIDMKGTLRKGFFVHVALSTSDESTVCSPISALMPLGKLALGADGQSLEELLSATGVENKSMIGNHFKPLITYLRYIPGVKLNIASKLYVSMNGRLRRSFADPARDIFKSTVQKLDLQYPNYAAEYINNWVSSETNDLINNIISPHDIDPLGSAILVNAVYFNGRWKETFEDVHKSTFHAPTGDIPVSMMSRTGDFNYTKSDSLAAEIIEIPYTGDKASFIVVLPTSRTGLTVLLRQLTLIPEIFQSLISRMVETRIHLTMPKFKIESQLNLKDAYEKIGVKMIFNTKNSGLTNILDRPIHISTAKHKAFVEVNEFGTEAAASSALIMAKLAHIKALTIKANHPFLFFILAKGQQLFSGTLVNPKHREITL